MAGFGGGRAIWHRPCLPGGSMELEKALSMVCVLASVGALSLGADQTRSGQGGSASDLKPFTRVSDREFVQGKVSAKTDSTLTVDGKVIATTAATAVMKDGKPITTTDVHVGDKVKVAASKTADGSLQAVTVEVLGG